MAADALLQLARAIARRDVPGAAGALEALQNEAPEEAFARLATQQLVRITLTLLPEAELRQRVRPPLSDQLESWRRRSWTPPEALLDTYADLRRRLGEAGIDLVLLKGPWFGERLYGGIGNRPQHDLDVLVHQRDFRPARQTLRRLGFTRVSYDMHSSTFVRNGMAVDLHHCLRSAPAFRIDEARLWETTFEADAGRCRIRALSDEWSLVLLILSAFEDLGQGTAKLKQLIDLYLLARLVDASLDWPRFFAARSAESTDGAAAAVLSLVVALFDGRQALPHLVIRLAEAGRPVDATGDEALALVVAERKSPANLAWFARVYPGALWLYLMWFWYAGFPANVRPSKGGHPLRQLAVLLSRAWRRSPRSIAGSPPA